MNEGAVRGIRADVPGVARSGSPGPGDRGGEDSAATAWRPDVDGLRAVAVLAVIVFHLRREWLPGGFAGVDVFFVISGFLITRAILSDLAEGRFSRAEFYRRRVKRISLPMLAVVFATVVAAQCILLPEDALATAWSGLAAVFSVANVYFWKFLDRSYFAPGSDEVPLLHLWSLGVEEQFYFVWPWVVPWLWNRFGARDGARPGGDARAEAQTASDRRWSRTPTTRLVVGCSVVALASFALGSFLYPRAPWFGFYMLPTRAGELLIGAILAFGSAAGGGTGPGRAAREVAGVLGAVLVLGSFELLSQRDPFPGWRAVPPTVGAGLVLLAGSGGPSLVSRLLGLRPLVAIGLVSYSAYLWHWPLIAFWRYGFRGVGTSAALGIFVATFALAAASHRWIERPARRTTDSPARVALRQWFLPGAVIAAACVLGVVTRGYGPRLLSRGYVDGLAALSPQADFSRRSCLWDRIPERRFEDPHCRIGDDEDPDGVLVLGDSNAAHFVPMLEVFARAAGFRFRNAEAHACPPPFDGLWRFALPSRQTDCESTVATTKSALRRSPVVVLGTVWSLYASDPGFLDALFSRVREFVAGGQHVILLAQIPPLPKSYDPRCRARALSFPGLRCPRQVESRLTRVVKPVNDRLREFAERTPGVGFFDANPELCPGGVCRAYAADGTEIYWDYAHLTVSGARRLGEDVLRTRGVPSPFDRVPQWLAESGVGGDRQGD